VDRRHVAHAADRNGWAWKCSIRGADSGALAGRMVGVKDNVRVAGLPMLNDSPIMDG
jgi:amidase